VSQGGSISHQILIPVPDPEKNQNAQDLELLEPPSDLVQALLLLEPMSVTRTNDIDPQLPAYDDDAGDLHIYIGSRCQVEAGASHMTDDSPDSHSGSESNSGSS